MPLRFVLDDIAESECDAIVYAAVPSALEAGCAPAPGVSLEEERQIFAGLGRDELRITYANDLYCTYVIHVPCPAWAGDGHDTERLERVYRAVLQLAVDHDCRSVAFPLIGAGDFPEDAALRCAVDALGEASMDVEVLFADPAAYDHALALYPERK